MADSYNYAGTGDAPSLADESTRGEMDELLILLEEKDADLRRAAELGKMLLDEKEADAEAHEGEKEALWRRIQDMARRVMELEQEAAESRDEFSSLGQDHDHDHPFAAEGRGGGLGLGGGGGGGGRRVSVGGGDRAEERALRAKNEMLERQLAHMREEAEEAQLELAAARKAQFSRRSSRHHHHTRSGRSNSILSSPAVSLRLGRPERSFSAGGFSAALGPLSPADSFSPGHFTAAAAAEAAAAGGGSACRSSSRLSSAAPVSRWSLRSPVSAGKECGGGGGGGDGVGDGADSEASNDELRAADRAHASARRGSGVEGGEESDGSGGEEEEEEEEHDAAWLLEQNAWLMEELESKDELIEALREQITELRQHQHQQWGGQGPHPSSPMQPRGDRGQAADSDDDDEDSEDGQRSFLDHLLHASGGGGTGGGGANEPPRDKDATADAALSGAAGVAGVGSEPTGTGTAAAAAADGGPGRTRRATLGVGREKRRSFGGILTENVRLDAAAETNGAENTAGRRAQSKSPTRGGGDSAFDGENSPLGAASDKPRRAFSPTRRRGAAAAEPETAAASSLSPARPGRGQPAGEVTGVVGLQARDADAAAASGAGVVPSSGGGSSSSFKSGSGSVSDPATPAVAVAPAAAATAAAAVSEKGADAAGTEQQVAPGTPQQQQQQQDQQQHHAVVSSSSAVSCADNPVSVKTAAPLASPAPPVPGAPERTTTVSGRKRAAAAAKAKARQREAEAAAAAAAEAQQREASSAFAQMSRAEKKSRQAVEKLGLRAVAGVFRMTMRTSNGVVFIVKAPDVFKHPQQDTYVVFGAADTDSSGGEVSRPPPRVFTPATTSDSLDGKVKGAPTRGGGAASSSSRPDPSAVEIEAVSAGLDPADVLTIVSHAGCSPRAAIGALREAGGDVVNAVMNLADAGAPAPSSSSRARARA